MSNNIYINNSSVIKVVNVINKVNIEYYVNGILKYDTYQSPGDLLTNYNEIEFVGSVGSNKKYNIIYSWKNGNVDMPLLVPEYYEAYSANVCELLVPADDILILYEDGEQFMDDNEFTMNSQEPLYFSAYTLTDGSIKKVSINSIISYSQSTNIYEHTASFFINNPIYQGGAPKTYEVVLKIYKDHLKTKYLGSINLSIILSDTFGPGE